MPGFHARHQTMFNKVLIANRGEIAIRIMATCREMDIRTVAIYSAADCNARHVREADQAYYIGPPASAMQLMGSKIAAKHLAHSIGAPTIPGYDGENQEDTTLITEAQRIGFPLLIKASAGGGGKGMRIVYAVTDFKEHLASARREALASFGDATVFLERLIQQPRHVEIQVLGDTFGHLIHLGERECSIQRRHQKIVEESPSVALTPALRAEMGAT